ncbi:helix-turn-helix domain-containing protein [Kitasatospora sp. NPDC096077]|uniref:helix-turn-helix domain-containing protein n=1 Tax=Kitasatospora sp. NPDC096077 TaxID=3155544 RepID=UPI003326BF1A
MDVPDVGPLLRRWRLRAGLTQEELAERSGLSSRAIRDLERGRVRRPRLSTVRLLAEAMGLTEQERSQLSEAARPVDPVADSPADSPADRPADLLAVDPPTEDLAATVRTEVVHTEAVHTEVVHTEVAATPPGPSRPGAWRAAVGRLLTRDPFGRVKRLGALAAACLLTAVSGDTGPGAGPRPASPSEPVSYVARVGSDSFPADPLIGSTGTDLPVERPVAAGDSLLVTVRLINAQPGPITVTDTAGNTYTAAGGTTDPDGNRLVILAAVHAKRLRPGTDRFIVAWPASEGDQVTVDEFHGITAVGSSAGTDSGHSSTASFIGLRWLCSDAADGLLLVALGSYAHRAGFSGTWQSLPELTLDQYRLAVDYRLHGSKYFCPTIENPVGPATRWQALVVAAR